MPYRKHRLEGTTVYWDGNNKVEIQGRFRVTREFGWKMPRIARNPDGSYQDRGGRMPQSYWEKKHAKSPAM